MCVYYILVSSYSALDEYIESEGKIPFPQADDLLKQNCQWDEYWKICDFDSYLPVLHLAREKKLKLVALGLPESIKQTVKEEGLNGLKQDEKSSYIIDPQGFCLFIFSF